MLLVSRCSPVCCTQVCVCLQAQSVAHCIGRAFHVAYMRFLESNGVNCHHHHHQQQQQQQAAVDYQQVVNQQEIYAEELSLFANRDLQKEVTVYLVLSVCLRCK